MSEPSDARPLLGLLLAHQRRGWRRGEPAPVETYLARQPDLEADAEMVLDLIYNEVVLRAEAGESPRLEEYQGRFPHLAAQLELQFQLEEALCLEPRPGGDDTLRTGLPPPPGSHRPAIPGYEVLGELGRGGMGVVYKARELRLNRVVALKMILAGAHAQPEAAVRFVAEAEAVARLDHPNIVQIFALGDHDGRPYYAMEYASGGSLADRLDGTPWSAGDAAGLVETLANALHEAHLLGIVHRDLKPANVLMAADGTAKVADFGLAKWLDVGSDLTRTDHILGSPSYMAPEQAGGGAFPIGPAADVYSLGAILYELLTGRPPFKAATVLETLEQVRSADPVAPSRLRPGLPRDLETVCLKCLAKEPARRYSGADVLAEDLRRFRAREPIRARPVGRLERTWRWCRREPALAAMAATLVAGLIGVATQWWRAERHLALEVAARGALQEARRRSQERFRLGMQAVGEYSALAGEEELLKDRRLQGLRRKLLSKALEFYTGLQTSLEADPAPQARSQLADAYGQVGWIQSEIGSNAEALASHGRALALWEALARDGPGDAGTRLGLARTYVHVGVLLRGAGRPEEALRSFERGLAILSALSSQGGVGDDFKADLAWCLGNLGALQSVRGRADVALRSQESAVALREELARDHPDDRQARRDLAWCRNDLGTALTAAGRPAEGLAAQRQALALWERLVEDDRDNHDCRSGASRSLVLIGVLLRAADRPLEATRSLERALAIGASLASDHPTVERYQGELAWCLGNLGALRVEHGRMDEAIRSFEAALAIREALARDHPDDLRRQRNLAECQHELGMAFEAAGRSAEALRWVRRAMAAHERQLRSHPADDGARRGASDCLANLGLLQRRSGDPEATRSFDRLVTVREALARDRPASSRDQASLASAYLYRATVRAAAGRTDEALVDIRRAERIARGTPDAGPNVDYNLACAYAQCSTGGGRGAGVGHVYAERAIEALRRAVARGYRNVAIVRRDLDLDPLRSRRDFQDLVLDLPFPADPFAR